MKKFSIILIAMLGMLSIILTGCGDSEETPSASENTAAAEESTIVAEEKETEITDEAAAEDVATQAETTSEYEWIGLSEFPQCDFMDLLTTRHYLYEYDHYIAYGNQMIVNSYCTARDGAKMYETSTAGKAYTMDGVRLAILATSGNYVKSELSVDEDELYEALDSMGLGGSDFHMLEYTGNTKKAVPLYSDETGDETECDCYEYSATNEDENGVFTIQKNVYLKDGDVFAIEDVIFNGEEEVSHVVRVITKTSNDIPAEMMELPDVSDLEEYKF